MTAQDDTARQESTWGELEVGDVWISDPPVNNTRKVVEVSPAPEGSVCISFDDGKTQIESASFRVSTVVQ